MSFAIIDLVAKMFIDVFGSPYIVAIVIFTFFIMLLLAMKADISVILMVIIPFTIGIGVSASTSNIINIPTWIILSLFMVAGIIFAAFILYLLQG